MDTDQRIITKQSLWDTFYSQTLIVLLQLILPIVVLLDYAFTDNLIHRSGNWFYLLIAFGYVTIIVPQVSNIEVLKKDAVLLGSYFLIIAFMFGLATPFLSPYILFLVHAQFEGIFWFGTRGYLISTSLASLLLSLNYYLERDTSSINLLLVTVALFVIIGGIFERLFRAQQLERSNLISFSENASFERQRLRSLINSMGDAVIATNTEGIIKLYNGAALELLNTNLTLEGTYLGDIISTMDEQRNDVDLLKIVKAKGYAIKRDDLIFRNNEDELVNIYTSVSPIHLGFGANGEEGFILLIRDITKEKSIEEQRDDFVSIVSHELRTPLAIAEANISTAMLPDIVKNKKQALDLLTQAHNNIIFLSSLVDDITTLAHTEKGDIDVDLVQINPGVLFDKVADTFKTEFKDSELDFIVNKPKDIPDTVLSNEHRIEEILQDLLANAKKYTEKGSVTFSLELEDDRLVYKVQDTGIGISTSDRKRVFEKFYRSENPETRQHSGTGLGLYIAWKLAKLINASIGVDSKLGKGSTFWLSLPLEETEQTNKTS